MTGQAMWPKARVICKRRTGWKSTVFVYPSQQNDIKKRAFTKITYIDNHKKFNFFTKGNDYNEHTYRYIQLQTRNMLYNMLSSGL